MYAEGRFEVRASRWHVRPKVSAKRIDENAEVADWLYNHERPSTAIAGITLKQRLVQLTH